MVAGGALAAAMTIVAAVATALEAWWLVTLAAMVLLSSTFLSVLDANRRVRALPGRAARMARRAVASARPRSTPTGTQAPVVIAASATEQDVLGAVRILQAQYVGRLDRLQASVEEELQQLRSLAQETRERERAAASRYGD